MKWPENRPRGWIAAGEPSLWLLGEGIAGRVMENLVFSLNATIPIFALMVLGYLFRKIGLIDEKAAAWMNKFVFKAALPVLVFKDLAGQVFAKTWDGKFVLFCFVATSLSIAAIALLSKWKITPSSNSNLLRSSFLASVTSFGVTSTLLGVTGLSKITSTPLFI